MNAEDFLDVPAAPAKSAAAFLDGEPSQLSAAEFLDGDPTQAAPITAAPSAPAAPPLQATEAAPPARPVISSRGGTVAIPPGQDPLIQLNLIPRTPIRQPVPVSQETAILPSLLRPLADVVRTPGTVDALLAPRRRLPDKVLDDFAAGTHEIAPEEFGAVLNYLERGAFPDPARVRDTLGPALNQDGMRMLDEAALVGQILAEGRNRESIVPGGDATKALLGGFVRGATFNEMGTPEIAGERVLNRASEIGGQKIGELHPVLSFAGEATGSVLPFSAGVKLLRGLRALRGLAPLGGDVEAYQRGLAAIEGRFAAPGSKMTEAQAESAKRALGGELATTEQMVKEGAIVGGPQSFAYKPEGAEDMSALEELAARTTQAGIGLAAGAALDLGAIKAGEKVGPFIGRLMDKLRDKRFERALKQEAKAKGFDDVESYLASFVDFETTPDGVVVKPKQDVLDALPGEAQGKTVEQPALPAKPTIPPFARESDLRAEQHTQRAREFGLTPEQAEAFKPQENTDPLTGFQARRDREPTLKRGIDYSAQTGQPGHYVALDLVNLGGLNARLGEPGADRVYKDMSSIYREELEQLPGHVNLFRHGGDELSAVVLGAKEDELTAALQRARARVQEYVEQHGLSSVPHTKEGKGPGTGVHYASSAFGEGSTVKDVLELAHDKLERAKEAAAYVDHDLSAEIRPRGPDQQTGGAPAVYRTETGGVGSEGTGPHRAPSGEAEQLRPDRDARQEVASPAPRVADEALPRESSSAHILDLNNESGPASPRVRYGEAGGFKSGIARATTPDEVAHVVAPLRKDAQESFLAVVTDDDGNILRIARLFKGSNAEAGVDPGLVAGAAASQPGGTRVWFVHNHPSGNAAQSDADREVTARLAELLRGTGIEPQGMIAVAPGGRYSFHAPGPDKVSTVRQIPAGARTEHLPVTERRLVPGRKSEAPLDTPDDLKAFLQKQSETGEGIVLLDRDKRPVKFVPMTATEMRTLRNSEGSGRRLLAAIDETNAAAFAAKVNAPREEARAVAGNLDGFSRAHGARLLDVVDQDFRSLGQENQIPEQSTFYANPFAVALKETARDVGLHPMRSAAAGFAGGAAGATTSDQEMGSAGWWLDVAAGAAGGLFASQLVRASKLLGKGSVVDRSRTWLGEWIEGLPLIGRGPGELQELKRKQRVMRQLIERQTEEVGHGLLQQFTPSERAMMADLIETRGIVKDLNVIHRQAQILDDYLVHAGKRMKELGMLSADLELGGYLHRYYAKHLGLDSDFRQAKKQSLSGSYSIARGADDTFAREYFSPGAHAIVDEFGKVAREIEKLETKRGDLLDGETAKRIAELKARRRELGKVELREFVGRQNGKVRSFLFALDEVGRVDSGTGRTLVDQHQPGPGLDTRALGVAGVGNLSPTDRVWTVRGANDKEALLHRDWTKAERQAWGEIDDAGYRYVRGMAEVAHDLSLATLFKTVARNPEWVSDAPRTTKGKEWVFVSEQRVNKHSPLQKYGALAGKYVRPDVWHGVRNYGRVAFAPGPVGDVYRGLLNKWKLYHTVYNPVTHLNNTYSNVEMLHMAGYNGRDLAAGIKHVGDATESALWREARDNGLFGQDWSSTLLIKGEGGGNQTLKDLAEALRTQPEIPDGALVTSAFMDIKEWWINSQNAVKGAPTKLATGAELAKAMAAPFVKGMGFALKPFTAAARSAQRLYQWEDNIFKMAVYQAERKKGRTPAQAIEAANASFFDYQDVPEAIKKVRDFPIGSPFITYTYKAIPAIARHAAQNPEYVLALLAGYEAWNYAAMTAEGMSPGEYWQVESDEDALSPPWERGRAIWGARNMVHMPFLEGYRLALGRMHAVGNPFMTEAGGRETVPGIPGTSWWGSSLAGSNPLHSLLDAAVNEDWRGKEIYKPGAPLDERAHAIAAYLYQAWAPSNILTPGSYHQTKVIEGLANDARKEPEGVAAPFAEAANGVSEALGFGQFTGLDRADNEIVTRDALLASFGIKLRPIRFDQGEDFELSRGEKEIKEKQDWFAALARKNAEGRITDKQLEEAERKLDRETEAIYQEMERTEAAGQRARARK